MISAHDDDEKSKTKKKLGKKLERKTWKKDERKCKQRGIMERRKM